VFESLAGKAIPVGKSKTQNPNFKRYNSIMDLWSHGFVNLKFGLCLEFDA
jgi:hypothetical protein